MIKTTAHLYGEMNEALGEIALATDDNLQRAEQSYQAVQAALQQVKEFILNYSFKDVQEEILFFKEIKPQFLSELIYYMKLFYIEAGKPMGNTDMLASYYKQAMERINAFFERNHTLYIYYRIGKNDHDEQYFVRTAEKVALLPEYSLDNDPKFSNVYSYKLAKMQAYERLNNYLQQALYSVEHPEVVLATGEKKKHRSLWTDTKAALIELAYAIHSRGSVNHGKGDVKQIIADLEILFNVQVGNFYRTFQSMRIRKKNRTPFLDGLIESLERRMDDTDLNYT